MVSLNPFRLVKNKRDFIGNLTGEAQNRALTPLQWDYVLENHVIGKGNTGTSMLIGTSDAIALFSACRTHRLKKNELLYSRRWKAERACLDVKCAPSSSPFFENALSKMKAEGARRTK
ncbi:hypothetical protein AUC60_01845 [Pseudomonas caspiana]|uniref:Uncharacterized protein n=1 Tax=Pseudomonas caspiana TaxID=1451454 RepID=A0A1Y3P7R7_9PSED|nr:hypothetical protein AUC60_01845 [Pseudomonas caspiana]